MELTKRLFSIIIVFIFIFLICKDIQAQGELDALLDMDISDLMNIEIITASKTWQRAEEVPATVRIITNEVIRESGYFTLEEAISDLPGFNFRNINGFNSYIFQRGIPNQNNLTLLLVDGIQINELNSGGFYGGGQFDLDNIKQIEVVYGPASSLYGTNAVSGIINIITKEAKDEPGLHISGLYGTFNTYSMNARYGYYDKENDFGIKISGIIKSSDKADLGGIEGDNNWYDDMESFEDDYALNLKIKYKNITVGSIYQNKRSSRTTNYKSIGTEYSDRGTLWNISFLNLYAKALFDLSDKLVLNSKVYYRNATVLDNTIGYITESDQVGYYRPNNLIGMESMLSYTPLDNLHVIGGFVFEYEKLSESFSRTFSGDKNVKPPSPIQPVYLKNNLVSFYLQSEYEILSNLSFTAGARYDHSSYYDDVLTPRVGVVFHEEDYTAKLLYNEAFRAPRPWDYTSGLGNPDLEPEKIKSIELDMSYKYNKNLLLTLSMYKNTLDQIFSQETKDSGWKWINKGKVEVFGTEVEIDFSRGPIKCYLNYTYNKPEDEEDKIIKEISEHSANIGLSYSFLKRFRINIRGQYIGEKTNPKMISAKGSDIIDDVFLLHSTISIMDVQNFNIFLIAKNIFDTEYYHSSNRPPDRYRQPQRSFQIKAEYHLF